jgi:clan AA aspartic protease
MDRFAWINLALTGRDETRQVAFLVDTGFAGELAVPQSVASWLGGVTAYRTVIFANGLSEKRGVIRCRIKWGDEEREVDAMVIDGEDPLLGIELLEDRRLTIEFRDKVEVAVERIERSAASTDS